ncbi:MAG: hypothetical protein HY905_06675 [Deltaproteobacteria bacterium]|nr:hypothetical protein [Deltaproteobacteria bacterium]
MHGLRSVGIVGLWALIGGCNAAAEGDDVPIDADVPGDSTVDVAANADADADADGSTPSGDLVVLAWNDLGMHCLSPSYDTAVILPPYNTLWAQVVRRGDPPQLVTTGVTVEYRFQNNTYSCGKRDYGQFWDHAAELFGGAPPRDHGLDLADPSCHNGLSGTMVVGEAGDHFEVRGVPLVPVDDSGTWNPFQVAVITVRDPAGTVVAETQATAPTSDEIDCAMCHASGGDATVHIDGGGDNVFANVLAAHDALSGTHLSTSTPVLCASCHGSPALGATDPGSSGKYLSEAMHSFHSTTEATCYSCHPGATTHCSRSLAHTADDGNCTTCHGDVAHVGASIADGTRTPWVNEPRCVTCHAGVADVDTGATLYRNASAHSGLYCAACHQSPHAMVPSREASDNYQALQLQGAALTLGDCRACHATSRGGGDGEAAGFAERHGGPSPATPTGCNICHTSVSADTARWPHSFQWHSRP